MVDRYAVGRMWSADTLRELPRENVRAGEIFTRDRLAVNGHPVHCVTRRQQPRGAMSKGFTGSRVGPAEVIRRVCGPRSPVDVQASACYRRGVMGEYQIEAAG